MRRVDELREIPLPKIVPELRNNPITPETVVQSHEMRLNEIEDRLLEQKVESNVGIDSNVHMRLNQMEEQNQEYSSKMDEMRDMIMKLQAFMIETNMMVTESKRAEEVNNDTNSKKGAEEDMMNELMGDGNALEKMLN